MSSEFDPYREWLGIESQERPPNHYQLLGLEDLESENDVINAASIKRVERIQDIASGGQHSELSQRILNEIAAARLCLMDPESRQKYELSTIKSRANFTPISERFAKSSQEAEPTKPEPAPEVSDSRESFAVVDSPKKKKPQTVSKSTKKNSSKKSSTQKDNSKKDSSKKSNSKKSNFKSILAGGLLALLTLIAVLGVVLMSRSNSDVADTTTEPTTEFYEPFASNSNVNVKSNPAPKPARKRKNSSVAKKGNKPAKEKVNKPGPPKTKPEEVKPTVRTTDIASYKMRSGKDEVAPSPVSQGWIPNEKLDPKLNKAVQSGGTSAWLAGGDRKIGPHYTQELTSQDYEDMWNHGWIMVVEVKPIQGDYMIGWSTPADKTTKFKPGYGPALILNTQGNQCTIRSTWSPKEPTHKIQAKDFKNGLYFVIRGEPQGKGHRIIIRGVENGRASKRRKATLAAKFRRIDQLQGLTGWTTADGKGQEPASAQVRLFRLHPGQVNN